MKPVLSNMRVLFVNQALQMGGAERQALHLARYLKDEMGADVHFWGFEQPGLAMERSREWGIPSRLVPVDWRGGTASLMGGALGFLAECRELRPTIILPYTHPANVVCGLTWRSSGAGVCIWNQRDAGLHRLSHTLEWLAVKSTRWFVANSAVGAAFLTADLGVREGLVRVVRNGLAPRQASPSREEARERFGLPMDAFIASMIANLHENKDHETLLRAWSQVHQSTTTHGRDSVLLLVGRDQGELTRLTSLAEHLGLPPTSVRFLGQIDDPGPVLSAADLCVHSTKSEASPNAVLEAMGAGLPVAGTDVPGMRETVGEKSYPYLAAPGDVEGLAERILRFFFDQGLGRQVGRENMRRASRAFSLDSMCARMTSLIVSALQERGVARDARVVGGTG